MYITTLDCAINIMHSTKIYEKKFRKNERGRGWGEFNIKRTAFQLVENKLPVWTKSFKGEK